MGINISSPENSFVKFGGTALLPLCEDPAAKAFVFPVVEDSDVAFQFFLVADTISEADALCETLDASDVVLGLGDCDTPGVQVTFPGKPARIRISETVIRYDWSHGLQGMTANYIPGDCFSIKVQHGANEWCSQNRFQRIPSGCFTSVMEYSNTENFAGFIYCAGGAVAETDVDTCLPDVFEFLNQSALIIPYTALMLEKWGPAPNVQVWIFNPAGQLQQMGISATLDAYPPTVITLDFGGPASGYVRIK